ncbi:hypothetical protein [Sphingomonas soli]|uniref:hypothetical protein n=1 Tax=Sphingomonas soli TaxID=266127 RepID=UPI000830DD56|nr:hypothetical protein [Sphingomonas soli]
MKILMLTLAAAACLAAAPASAQTPTGAEMIAAGEQLKAKLETAARGAQPRLDNEDAALVRRAFDANALRAMPLSLEIGNICVSIGGALLAYAEFAGRVANGESGSRTPDALILAMQNEISLGTIAANVCVQRGYRAVTETLTGLTPAQRAGTVSALAQMREGGVQTIEGTVDTAATVGMSPANRSAMLASILEDLPTIAASFPAAERAALRQKVLAYSTRFTADERKQIDAITRALTSNACNILCETAGSN